MYQLTCDAFEIHIHKTISELKHFMSIIFNQQHLKITEFEKSYVKK